MKTDSPHMEYYGIRHHGPGSANSLLSALEIQMPDVILIEGPSDAQSALPWLANEELRPPVAIVVYDVDQPENAIFYPLAFFSPEWQAMQFAVRNKIPFHFIDLPFQKQLSLRKAGLIDSDSYRYHQDPFQMMAAHLGWEDGESWWDAHFESYADAAVFAHIADLMAEFRSYENEELAKNTFTALREAFMKLKIAQLTKKAKSAAIICGAWHVPALSSGIPVTADQKYILSISDTVKTKSVWIPWTYRQLGHASGYRSGVSAPVWYEMLFQNKENAVLQWMAYVAQISRQKGFEISPASSMDATVLATTLASMRGYRMPAYQDLKDAVLSVYGWTYHDSFNELLSEIPYGNAVGQVPDDIEQTPLQKDILKQLKSLRLHSVLTESKPVFKILDLRKEAQRAGSIFLYRLWMLDIPFGQPMDASVKHTGTFREEWKLLWRPEFHLKIIEAGIWGNTLLDAIMNKIRQTQESLSIERLIDLLDKCLYADIPMIPENLMQNIANQSIQCKDVFVLIKACISLQNVLERGDARNLDKKKLRELLEYICLGIIPVYAAQCQMIPLDEAEKHLKDIPKFHMVLKSLGQESIQESWKMALQKVSAQTDSVHHLHGISFRIYLDYCQDQTEIQHKTIRLIFSNAEDPISQAAWIQGFIYDNYLLLLFDPELFRLLNEWLAGLETTAFNLVLPVMRKVLADTPPAFKVKLLAQLKPHTSQQKTQTLISNESRDLLLNLLNDESE